MINYIWEESRKIYIVGAQSRGKTLKGYLNYLYPLINIDGFLVDDITCNDTEIEGIPVLEINSTQIQDYSTPVFIATKGVYHEKIIGALQEKGFKNIIPVTVELDNELRNSYVERYYKSKGWPFVKLENLSTKGCYYSKAQDAVASIYVAKSVWDKPLQSYHKIAEYEKIIQVGAILEDVPLEDVDLLDSNGDNISKKNRQYCELTALYWLWKNCKDDIIGLSHYRRHFILPHNWKDIMISQDIDVVLPVPTYVYPNISENYKERHDSSEWKHMLDYLELYYKEYYSVARQIYSKNLYFPCNMLIAKREILADLCAFIFPILDAVVEYGGVKKDAYLNRYPGFLSERLNTLFFIKNREKYKIVYADKNFIS